MNLKITGRHLEITPALEDYIEKKSEKIKFYFPRLLDINVILTLAKNTHIIEITTNSEGKTFHCESKTDDMYESIDKGFDKMERQVKRYKDRIVSRRGKGIARTIAEQSNMDESDDQNDITKVRQIAPKPKTALEAIMQLSIEPIRFDIFKRGMDDQFRDGMALKLETNIYYLIIADEENQWFRKKVELKDDNLVEHNIEPFDINELTLEDAVSILSSNGKNNDDHLVFIDIDLRNLNILYKRKNNTLGLITSGGS